VIVTGHDQAERLRMPLGKGSYPEIRSMVDAVRQESDETAVVAGDGLGGPERAIPFTAGKGPEATSPGSDDLDPGAPRAKNVRRPIAGWGLPPTPPPSYRPDSSSTDDDGRCNEATQSSASPKKDATRPFSACLGRDTCSHPLLGMHVTL